MDSRAALKREIAAQAGQLGCDSEDVLVVCINVALNIALRMKLTDEQLLQLVMTERQRIENAGHGARRKR